MEEEPKDVLVLTAIANGKTDEKKIAQFTRLTPFEVASVVERLILKGLIERTEKKGLLGKKSILNVTEKGGSELRERRFELEQRYEKMVTIAKQGDKKQFEQMVEFNRSWIPVMIFMGIIDMMFWMSMLSMMGMAFHDTVPEGYDAGVEEGAGPDAGSDFGDLGDIGI
jgi:DNA-binding MarR family transcriptional regulator